MNPIYCKYSNDRAEKFQIKTAIWQEPDGRRFVRKYWWKDAAKEHVEKFYLHYLQMEESFAGEIFSPNRCEKKEDGVELEYVEGETFEQHLDHLYLEGCYAEIVEEIKKYKELLYNLPDNIPFCYTEEFDEVFGKEPQFLNCRSLKISNIDLIFGNLIPKERWIILDYEWIFDFPVPIDFIIYRAVHYYVYGSTKRSNLREFHLFKLLGISDEDQAVYAAMERSFQAYVAGEKHTMSELKAVMMKGHFNVQAEILNKQTDFVQFYMDDGAGYREAYSQKVGYCYFEQRIEAKIRLPEGTVSLRIDPASCEAVVKDLIILADGRQIRPSGTNSRVIDNNMYIFLTPDPQILLADVRKVEQITVRFSVVALHGAEAEQMLDLIQKTETLQEQCRKLEQEKAEMANQIEAWRSTRLWRMYSGMKRIFRR